MVNRRMAALIGGAAIIFAACSSTGSSPSAAPSGHQPPPSAAGSAAAGACKVGVSWNNFQQPRWAATDEPAMQKAIEDGGGTFIRDRRQPDSQQQLTDIDTLISQGAKVLIILAQDNKAILPAIQKAKDAGIPVIAYDRLIEDPSSVLYITFDNVAVGTAEAETILAKVPKGNYVLIKGDPGDPNASTFLPQGWDDAGLKDEIAAGEIKIMAIPRGRSPTAGRPRTPRTTWRRSSTRPTRPARRSTPSCPRTTARRSASSLPSTPRTTGSRRSAVRTATRPT